MRELNHIERKKALVRQVQNKIQKLKKAKYELGEIPLKKPLRYGWYKRLILRQDIARRKDAYIYEEILNTCGRWVWGRDKKMTEEKWAYQEQHNPYWQWSGFSWIEKDKYELLTDKAKKYFVKLEWKWSPWHGCIYKYYCVVPKYYFVQSYKKAYVTHTKIVDSKIDKELEELNQKLLSNDLYAYSWYGNSYWSNSYWKKRMWRKDRHGAKKSLRFFQEE